jgi:putative acetyltransferase
MNKEVRIIDYRDEHQPVFKQLNLEWLDHYDLTESHDLEVLNDPRETILNNGGAIYLASCDEMIVGSAALMKESEGVYQLAKMTVTKDFRRRGISRLLIDKCLEKAREFRARKIILFSNHLLLTAIGLYEKYGFKHVDAKDSPFETADIKMELELFPVNILKQDIK